MQLASRVASLPPIGLRKKRDAEADLNGLLQILQRNFVKIVAATVLSTLLALGYLTVAKPVYTATASLFVDPRSRKAVSDDVVENGFGTDLALVESQASILTSDTVLSRVVEQLHLQQDPEYAPTSGQGLLSRLKAMVIPRPPAADPATVAVNTLADSIKVKRAQKSYVVDVDVTASSPDKAARVTQALLDSYLADQTAAKSAEAKRANTLIDGRLGELRKQVRSAEEAFDDYKRRNNILTSDGGVVTEQQLSKLNTELGTASGVTAEAKARFDEIKKALRSGAGPEVLPDAIRSGLIQRLREQYAQVARREASLASQLQPRHPVLIDVRSQLAEVKSQINAELKRIAVASQSEYQIAQARERELRAQIDKTKEDVTRINTAQIKARELDQEVATSRELLRVFLQRAKETQEQQSISTPDARIITPPSSPTRPSRPIAFLVLGLGLLGGLGLGLAWALVSDHMDDSVHSGAELEKETGIATVASLPALRGSSGLLPRRVRERIDVAPQAAQFSDLLVAISDTNGKDDVTYRQAVLRLLGKIKMRQRPGRPHTVMLASPHSGLGNSATTLALAYAAAVAGERVLLVDATSTNPELSRIFATTLAPTNAVVLDSKEHLSRITTRDSRSGLAFLPIALADLRKLKTQQRRRLVAGLNALSQDYDLIFIDAGALIEDEAATSLLPAADQVLIVGRAGVTSADQIAVSAEILDGARDRVTGTILTMSRGAAA